jgi:protein-disulfide isomerase
MSRLIVPALVATAALLAGCASSPAGPAGGSPSAAEPAPAQFNVMGREDAPVTIIEFTDLQCPYCARHAARTFPLLKRDYVDTGKLRYASRDLPLPFHSFALPAAVASRCAGEQGRFWEYRDALFAAQGTLGTEPYGRIAGELGLDVARLEACRSDGRQEAAVRADLALAAQYGIRSTPTFVIGRVVDGEFQGEVVSGAQPYEFFEAKLDALLAAPR